MRFIIAPDAFKGALSAFVAAEAMAAGIRDAFPDSTIVKLPLADGGEGTLAVLRHYGGGELRHYTCDTPYGFYETVCLRQGDRAVIESALLVGLTLPQMQTTPVMQRSSWVLGKLIHQLIDEGVCDFVVGLGGSATNDGGLGMLMALGMQAIDAEGQPVSPNAEGLLDVAAIDMKSLTAILSDCRFTILSDVTSPLYGATGATAVYGPQKGMVAADITRVDAAMHRYASLCQQALGVDVAAQPGTGAAGGLGFALMLPGGMIRSGADYVMSRAGVAAALQGADWLLTGEGRSDAQTLAGKLPLRVAKLARRHGMRTALIAGDIDADARDALAGDFDAIMAVRPAGMALGAAMAEAASLLRAATVTWAREL